MSRTDAAGAGDARAVSALAARLYGEDPGPTLGVLHVVAVWAGPPLTVMRIEPTTPKSDADFFALNFARARVGAIVVTGKILREEPALRYDLQGPGRLPEGLTRWRAAAGLAEPPLLVVLTSGRGLDFTHPAFHSWARPVVFTGVEAAAALSPPPGARVVGVERPSLRAALSWLAGQGIQGVSVEAGPSTALQLYEAPLAVGELMLSEYHGALAEHLQGGTFVSRDRLDALIPPRRAPTSLREPSGRWTFSLRRRG